MPCLQLLYLLTLLSFLAGGAFLVVRQVLVRRELDEAAKALGERIRTGEASCEVSAAIFWLSQQCVCLHFTHPAHTLFAEASPCSIDVQDYFELGVVLTRKKLYTQATKNLEKAKKIWDGEESELAQVRRLCLCLGAIKTRALPTATVCPHSSVFVLEPSFTAAAAPLAWDPGCLSECPRRPCQTEWQDQQASQTSTPHISTMMASPAKARVTSCQPVHAHHQGKGRGHEQGSMRSWGQGHHPAWHPC